MVQNRGKGGNSRRSVPANGGAKRSNRQPRPRETVNLNITSNALVRKQQGTGSPAYTYGRGWTVVENEEIILAITPTFETTGIAPATSWMRKIGFTAETADANTRINALNLTRFVGNFAKNFDKFTIEEIILEYRPVTPVTTAGGVALRFESDAHSNTLDDSAEAMASGNLNCQIAAAYEGIKLRVLPNQTNRLPQYDIQHAASVLANLGTTCAGSVRFATDQLMLSRTLTTATAVNVGYVKMKYRIKFINPSVN
nr:MAG: putative coat protein [Tombusviridae sp.]